MRHARVYWCLALISILAVTAQDARAHGGLGSTCGLCHATRSDPFASGDRAWEARKGGSPWIPAFAPYPNPITKPPSLSPAELMWLWDKTDTPTGANGPNEATFRVTLDLAGSFLSHYSFALPVGAWVAADDWLELVINGKSKGTYLLDDHKRSDGQPEPIFIPFDTSDWLYDASDPTKRIRNEILINARDGDGTTAYDRQFEWVYFESRGGTAGDTPLFEAPEPAALSILALACLALAALRRQV